MICAHCKSSILSSNLIELVIPSGSRIRYFCSDNCLSKYKSKYHVGTFKSAETRSKISRSNSKPHSAERKLAISKAKKIIIPDDELVKIKELLMVPYYPKSLISEELNLPMRCIRRAIIQLNDPVINNIEKNRPKFSHHHFKSYNKDILDFLAKNISNYTRNDVSKMFNLKSRLPSTSFVEKYFGSTYKRAKYKFHKGKTSPEKIFENILIENKIQYDYNKMILVTDNVGNEVWYSVDFVIGNNQIFIEIQGDYWHANPMFYSRNKLNSIQRNSINRDRRKKAQIITRFGKSYYQIWEYDIRNNTEKLKEQINEILCIAQKLKV